MGDQQNPGCYKEGGKPAPAVNVFFEKDSRGNRVGDERE
jgi:hypothetical protein